MRVLHIAGGFTRHSLYIQLVTHLRGCCDLQTIFAPVRSAAEMARLPPDVPGAIEFRYRHVLRPRHRIFFRSKVRACYGEMGRAANPSRFDLVHAHTLYSDGALALRLKREWNKPFIVAVRNTDLNFFMPLRPDLHFIARDVLREASSVVFLSPAYRDALLSSLHGGWRAQIAEKSVVIPNGIGADWLAEPAAPMPQESGPLRILYVGEFSRNKNVPGLLRAATEVATRIPLHLTLVGSGGRDERIVRASLERGAFPFARWLGRVDDRRALRSIYRQHDLFAMPSFKETFGVVYLEALSQGVPVLHSRGQGIDGLFQGSTVSEAVDPRDIREIAAGIERLAGRARSVRDACRTEAQRFSWQSIANRYDEIYRLAV